MFRFVQHDRERPVHMPAQPATSPIRAPGRAPQPIDDSLPPLGLLRCRPQESRVSAHLQSAFPLWSPFQLLAFATESMAKATFFSPTWRKNQVHYPNENNGRNRHCGLSTAMLEAGDSFFGICEACCGRASILWTPRHGGRRHRANWLSRRRRGKRNAPPGAKPGETFSLN